MIEAELTLSRRRLWRMLVAFLCLLVIVIIVDVRHYAHSSKLERQSMDWMLSISQYRSDLANAHIWLEEYLTVRDEPTLSRYHAYMQHSQQRLRELLQTVPDDSDDKHVQHIAFDAKKVDRMMAQLTALAVQRLRKPADSVAGSTLDKSFDHLYDQLVEASRDIHLEISEHTSYEHQQHLVFQRIAMAVLLLLIIAVLTVLWLVASRYRQTRILEQRHLQALQSSELRFRSFFENSPVALKEENHTAVHQLLQQLDENQRNNLRSYLQNNPAFLQQCAKGITINHANLEAVQLYGYADEQTLMADNQHYLQQASQAEVLTEKILLLDALARGEAKSNSRIHITLKNKQEELLHCLMGIRILARNPWDWSRVVISQTNINDMVSAKSQLDAANQHLEQAQNIVRLGSWEMEFIAGNLQWSNMVYDIFGFTHDIDPSYDLFINSVHPDDRQRVEDAWQAHIRLHQEYRVVHRVIRPDGSQLYVEERCQTQRDGHGNPLRALGTVQDITRLMHAEKESRLLRDVFDTVTDMIAVVDADYCLIYANQALRAVLGIKHDDSLTSLRVEDCFAAAELAHLREKVIPDILRKGWWQGEALMQHPQSGEFAVSQILQAHHDADGKLTHISMIARDISEERKQQEKLEHMQRLESLGVLAGGIAHDFNNLLTAIMGHAAMARERYSDHGDLTEHLEGIVRSSNSAADLCRQMLAYSGKGKFVIKHVDISELLNDMGRLLSVSIGKQVALHYELTKGLPAIAVDVAQMQQVMMNLVINASEAIGDNVGTITLSTGICAADADYLQSMYLDDPLSAGDYVYIEVTDTGCGMADEVKSRLFEPFYTTKFTGRGLGMSAILGIIRGHHGTIKVYSEQGKGSSFKVLLPAKEETPTPMITQPQLSGDDDPLHGTVLIIDDEQSIREVATLAVKQIGLQPLQASDGIEGIACYREHQQDIVCILLDMMMPRMGGEDTFSALRQIDPDVRVILTSGYNEQTATQRFVGKSLAGFIQKPYTPKQLQEKIRHLLN